VTRDRSKTLVVPLLVFYAASFVASQIVFLRLSLYPSAGRAAVDTRRMTLDNFATVFTDAYYQAVILQTLSFGLAVVGVCLGLGYPLSYVIARSRRAGTVLLLIVVVSSFTGVVVRALGWRVLLGDMGPVNWALMSVGLTAQPIALVNNMTGAIIGTAHASLPYMILLLVPVLEGIDPQLEEAAAGLGSSWWDAFRSVVVPLSLPGVVAGCLLVFATTVGSFTTPSLLGGPRAPILPIVIRQQITTTLNYPLGAALAVILVVLVVTIVLSTSWVGRRIWAR